METEEKRPQKEESGKEPVGEGLIRSWGEGALNERQPGPSERSSHGASGFPLGVAILDEASSWQSQLH